MKIWRTLLVLFAMLFATAPVHAGEGDGVRARLAKPVVLRGEFVQEKQLHGFRNPLKSSGDFLLLRDRGIAWNTRAPFASSTRLTRKKLLATMPDGSTHVLIDASTRPAWPRSCAADVAVAVTGCAGDASR